MRTTAAITRGTRSSRVARPGQPGGCRGMTLVELLIALALSLLLAIAIVQLFIGNKKTFLLQESTARLQENARFALAFIAADVRGAGYSGCLSDRSQINNTLNGAATSPLWGFTQVVQGFDAADGNWAPDWGPGTGYEDFDFDTAIAGTDIITLHTVGRLAAKATQGGPMTGVGAEVITLSSNPGLAPPDIIFITDCERGAITQITGLESGGLGLQHEEVGANPGNSTPNLGTVYPQSEVYEMRATSYFIAPGAGGQPALWREVDASSQELVQGVENMQILYGVADDVDNWGTVSRYITAEEVDDADAWERVAAVRIRLLVRGEANVLEQSQTYRFNGADVDATDRRVHREFSTTIGLRNRIL